MGLCYNKQKNYELCIENMKNCVKYKSDYLNAIYMIGHASSLLKNY